MGLETGANEAYSCVITANTQGRLAPLRETVRRAVDSEARWVGITEAPDGPEAGEAWEKAGYVWHPCPSATGSVGLAVRREESVRIVKWEEKEELGMMTMTMQYEEGKMGIVVVRLKPSMDIPNEERDVLGAKVMDEIQRLTKTHKTTMVMGDMNQVGVPTDRITETKNGAEETENYRGLQLIDMKVMGFEDLYRVRHADGGYTNYMNTSRGECRSRLDYIFLREEKRQPRVAEAQVFPIHKATTHYGLEIKVKIEGERPKWEERAVYSRILLGRAEMEQKRGFAQQVHEKLLAGKTEREYGPNHIEQTIERVMKVLTKAAKVHLPTSKARMSNMERYKTLRVRLKRLRKTLGMARVVERKNDDPPPDLMKRFDARVRHLDKDLRNVPARQDEEKWQAWVGRVKMRRKKVQRLVKGRAGQVEQGEVKDEEKDMYIRKAIRGQRLNELDAVMVEGKLVYEPEKVKKEVWRHMSKIASTQSPEPRAQPGWLDECIKRSNAAPQNYEGLVSKFTSREMRKALARLDWGVAAGPDGIGGGILRLLAQEKVDGTEIATKEQTEEWLSLMVEMTWGIFKMEGRLQMVWDTTTKPLWKKEGCRLMTNIRPIALQNAIAKVPGAILAQRLTDNLAKAGTMHYAQDAFLKGGRAENVVWTALNMWSHHARERKPYYSVMYDWVKAYDTIPWWALKVGMQRMSLPNEFQRFVLGSLSGARTKVRTAYGETEWVGMVRGVKQGDPLAPLLYIIVMDMLHDELHQGDGVVMEGMKICSKGFADDVWLGDPTWEGIEEQHGRVLKFCEHFAIGIHAGKSALLGLEINRQLIDLTRTLPGQGGEAKIEATHEHQKLLGVWVRPPGNSARLSATGRWHKQSGVLGFVVHKACRALRASRLTLAQGAYAVKAHIWPKLAYRLKYYKPKYQKMEKWQKMIVNAITRLGGGKRRVKAEAMALTLGMPTIKLEAKREMALEMRRRLVDKGTAGATTREQLVGRDQGVKARKGTLLRKGMEALSGLGITLVRPKWDGIGDVPAPKRKPIRVGGETIRLFSREQKEYKNTLEMCVDGSFVPTDKGGRAGWAVVYITDTFRENWETLVRNGQPSIYTNQHSVISGLQGRVKYPVQASFDPELEAVLWAVRSAPDEMNILIHVDNEGVVKKVGARETEMREDRTYQFHRLQTTRQAIEERKGKTTLRHIPAHQKDINTVQIAANAVCDARAEAVRLGGTFRQMNTSTAGSGLRLQTIRKWASNQDWNTHIAMLPIKQETKRRVRAIQEKEWQASRTQSPGWEVIRVAKWVREWGRRGFKPGTLVRIATGVLFQREYDKHKAGQYYDECVCGGEEEATYEHLRVCEHKDIREVNEAWVRGVEEGLKDMKRAGPERMRQLDEEMKGRAKRRIKKLNLASDNVQTKMYIRIDAAPGERDRFVRFLSDKDLRKAAEMDLYPESRKRIKDSLWPSALLKGLEPEVCECEEGIEGRHEVGCGGWGRIKFRGLMRQCVEIWGVREELVDSPIDASPWANTWWTENEVKTPDWEGDILMWCTNHKGDKVSGTLRTLVDKVESGALGAAIIIAPAGPQWEACEGKYIEIATFPANTLKQAPDPLWTRINIKKMRRNNSEITVGVIGNIFPLPSHQVVDSQLDRIWESWKEKKSSTNDNVMQAIKDEVSDRKAGTHAKWINQVASRIVQAKRGRRAFYGVWDKGLINEVLELGTGVRGLSEIRQAVTKVTIENTLKLAKTLQIIRNG